MTRLLVRSNIVILLAGCVDGDPTLTNPTITAEGLVASVEVAPAIDTLASLHDTVTFVAFAWDPSGNMVGGKTVAWSSSDSTVARIDQASGLATAMGNGAATISAKVESVTGTASVVVAQAVAEVTVTSTGDTLAALGDTLVLAASAVDAGGSNILGASFNWTSSNPNVATVSAGGIATAIGNGSTLVTAEAEGVSDTVSVYVDQVAVSLTVLPSAASVLGVGETAQFIISEARDANDSVVAISRPPVWGTLNPKVAMVDWDGLVTMVGDGQATIVAQADLATGYALVTAARNSADPIGLWHSAAAPANADQGAYVSVWGMDLDNVWATGDAVLHYDGTSWTTSTIEGFTWAIWGARSLDLWAVGDMILHYDWSGWQQVQNPSQDDLSGVWGSSPIDAWAVGGSGTIVHYDGFSWSAENSPVQEWLLDVWGTDESDVWAVGGKGTILHFNGTGWAKLTSPTTKSLTSVWGTSSSSVWAVGQDGTILHYDGTTWSTEVSPSTKTLTGVWGSGPLDVWAVGEFSTVIHNDGSGWTDVSPGLSGDGWLSALWVSGPGGVWTLGGYDPIHHGIRAPVVP